MPVHREKDIVKRPGKSPRTEVEKLRSVRSESGDGDRVIITQGRSSVRSMKVERKAGKGTDEAGKRWRIAEQGDGSSMRKTVGERNVKDTVQSKIKKFKVEEASREVRRAADSTRKGSEKTKSVTPRDRTRTRTLSPREVKQLIPQKKKEVPDAETSAVELTKETRSESSEGDEVEEYEDDFEDYESDFEEDDSESSKNEEEEEQPKSEKSFAMSDREKREMEEIKLAMKLENELANQRLSPEEAEAARDTVHSRPENREAAERARTRGRDLLGMITLDAISYSFLDIQPIPYEKYMKMFGRSNTRQVHVQTNEDDLDEETQTEEVDMCNKWVQKPPDVDTAKDHRLSEEDRLGVGGDDPKDIAPGIVAVDMTRLNEFLVHACQVLLPVLETGRKGEIPSEDIVFSAGYVPVDSSHWPFLNGKTVADVRVADHGNAMLTVHVNPTPGFGESIVCLWDIRQASRPWSVLRAPNRVTAIYLEGILALAGLSDGIVCLWDLRESSDLHASTADESGCVLRTPTYITVGITGHLSPVVSVQILKESNESLEREFSPMQVCTLEKIGTIIVWSVVQSRTLQNLTSDEDLGMAHWGRVKLVKGSSFRVAPEFGKDICVVFNDMALAGGPEPEMYAADNEGNVHRVSSHGLNFKPSRYRPKDTPLAEVTCLEMCPFDSNFFLAGSRDGSIRLYSRNQEFALISLNGAVDDDGPRASVVSLSWSLVRPFVIFVLDSLSRIHLWDLALSDMYPEVTLDLGRKGVTCARVMQTTSHRDRPHFVIGTAGGRIEIHRMKEEFSTRPTSDINRDMKRFLKYVSIL